MLGKANGPTGETPHVTEPTDYLAMTATDRIRERRREIREAISDAALDLVLARGLDSVTVDEIARSANVSRRTFFNYFPSKAAACIPQAYHPDAESVELLLTDRSVSTMSAVARFLWCHIILAHSGTRHFNAFHDIWRNEPGIRPEVQAVLAGTETHLASLVARRDGHPPDAAEPAAVAAAAVAILRVAVEQWRTDEAPELLESRIREAFMAVTESVRDPGTPCAGEDRTGP